jgi:hypothetical protein
MGQLNFFMTKEELVEEINQLLISEEYLLFEGAFFDSKIPKQINKKGKVGKLDRITIWIRNSKCYPTCSLKGEGEMKGKFLFDIYKDPIIEMDLGSLHNKLFSPGRLYYKTGWIKDEGLRKKHTKLTNKLVRMFKKRLITSGQFKPFYISEEVVKLIKKDHEIELGEGGMGMMKGDIKDFC